MITMGASGVKAMLCGFQYISDTEPPGHFSFHCHCEAEERFINTLGDCWNTLNQPPISPNLGGFFKAGGHPQTPGMKYPAPLFQQSHQGITYLSERDQADYC